MDSKRASDIASRLMGGGRLVPLEEQEYLEWLRKDDVAREAFMADEEIDGLLHGIAAVSNRDDEFVAATVQRVMVASDCPSEPPAGHASQATIHIDTGPPLPNRRRRQEWSLASPASFALLCASIVVAVGLVQLLSTRSNTGPDGETPIVGADRSTRPPLAGFATWEAVGTAEWNEPRSDGDRLGPGKLQLVRGEAVIRFDSGVVARVLGPAAFTLHDLDEVTLDRGRIAARVPPEGVGFTVTTPTSRVVDLGTEFEVSVDPSGRTETVVRAGRVSLVPQHRGGLAGRGVELSAEGLDRAVSETPDVDAPVLPVWTVAGGRGEAFHASIFADGKTLEFSSRDSFEESKSLVVRQLNDAPSEFGERWAIIVDAANAGDEDVDSSVAGSAADTDGTPGGGRGSTTVGDRTVSVAEDDDGITVTTVVRIGDREERSVVRAANRRELRMTDPAAFQLYMESLEAGSPSGGDRRNRRSKADELLREQLRLQLELNAGNPEMRSLLERMIRELEAEDQSPE